MAACPVCCTPIAFRTILLAVCPLWLTCPCCRARLVGDGFVGMQLSVVGLLSVFCGYVIAGLSQTMQLAFPLLLALLVALLLGVTLPNAYIAKRWGRFSVRD